MTNLHRISDCSQHWLVASQLNGIESEPIAKMSYSSKDNDFQAAARGQQPSEDQVVHADSDAFIGRDPTFADINTSHAAAKDDISPEKLLTVDNYDLEDEN